MTDCPHPPARHYAWFAYDGTLVVACCRCGEVLKGAADTEVTRTVRKEVAKEFSVWLQAREELRR
jgi:hypothetical protein